jgi:lysophospholipase L1-like esterase
VTRRAFTLAVVAALGWWTGTTCSRWRSLPSFAGADASGAFGDPTLPPLSIAVLGDSSCTGPGLDSIEDVWVQRVGHVVGKRFHVTMDSYAVGGSTAKDVLSTQVPKAACRRYDMAIVSVGGNDMLHGVRTSTFQHQLEAIVDALEPTCATTVLSGVGDMGTIPRLPWLLRWPVGARGLAADRAHAAVAAKHSHVFKVPIRIRADEFRTDLSLWAPDLFHASAAGHALYAEMAMPTIDTAIDLILTDRRSGNPTMR